MKQTLAQLKKEIKKCADPKRAKNNEWFFKTGKGEYGYGDKFNGLSMPAARSIAKKFQTLSNFEIRRLLKSPIHEERMVALLILVYAYEAGSDTDKEKIYTLYLRSIRHINNWDLVDTSAHYIVGQYLMDRPKIILTKLAKSKNLWERRIAIIATAAFIHHNKLTETFRIAHILLKDEHDLIHKAVGWMLREAGKRSQPELDKFLKKHYKTMPRTMLRYAIERFPEKKRQAYLKGVT